MKLRLVILLLMGIQLINAQKVLEEANLAFKKKEFAIAVSLYKESLKVVKSRTERIQIYVNLGDCYLFLNDLKNALKYYEQCYRARYKDPQLFLKMGEALMKMQEYDDAIEFLNIYLEEVPNDERAKNFGESCLFAKQNTSPIPGIVFKNVESLNTKYAEYGVAYTNNKIIFSSSRINNSSSNIYKVTGQGYNDFYNAEFDVIKNEWTKPVIIEGKINTPFNEGTCTFNDANNTLYFMICNGKAGDKNNCAIYYAQYDVNSNSWTEPELLNIADNNYNYGHPSISRNGKRLYFVSDMPGGEGMKDIWFMDNINGNWQPPQNAGNKINTIADEQFPFIYYDSILYFSSDGHPGYGGLDIYKSVLLNNQFSNPKNMGIPYNSSYDDFGIYMFTPDSGMMCSNRLEGKGDDDIYSFYTRKNKFFLTGTVFDKNTRLPIENATVILGNKNLEFDSVRTLKNGKYFLSNLKTAQEYIVTVYKKGYLGDLHYYTPTNSIIENEKDSIALLNFGLVKITDEEININNIYYDFGKWNLTPNSKTELMKLVRLLKVNPSINIRINSHTDAIGDENFNQELSNYRAQSVVNFLIENGVGAERLTFKGWGETKPVIENPENEEEQALNRRTSFQIVNIDDISTDYSMASYKSLTQSIVIGHVENLDAITGSFDPGTKKQVVFRLQIYAGKERISRSYLNQIERHIGHHKVLSSKGKDGYFRYAIGDFRKFDQAMEMKKILNDNGYNSFVIAFMNNLRITILEARQLSESNSSF